MRVILDRYIARQLAEVASLVAVTLAGILLMTQSLRFLELIIESGASGLAFITLSFLALPRFFEVILPLALAVSTLYVYSRLQRDGEVAVMQGAGMSPLRIAKSGMFVTVVFGLLLFLILSWLAPVTLSHMNTLRQTIKAQYSTLLFREGVFNSVGPDMTIYVAERLSGGMLRGLMIYDARPENKLPITILAREGRLRMTDQGQQVEVTSGARQVFNPEDKTLERLNFEKYLIDLPDSGPMQQRWSEPEERTLGDLLSMVVSQPITVENRGEVVAEIHRRLVSPFLAPCFYLLAVCALLLIPFGRTSGRSSVIVASMMLIFLQSLYITTFSWAKHDGWGIVGMYAIVFFPMAISVFLLFRVSRSRSALERTITP